MDTTQAVDVPEQGQIEAHYLAEELRVLDE
jgi:hypothetical protein